VPIQIGFTKHLRLKEVKSLETVDNDGTYFNGLLRKLKMHMEILVWYMTQSRGKTL
jgi:hypothetical protein